MEETHQEAQEESQEESLWQRCWPVGGPAPEVRDALLAAYAGAGGAAKRGYHDQQHLAEVLSRLEELFPPAYADRAAVLLAAWFHDAVYAGRPDDEERSALWAQREITPLDPDLGAEVARLVRLTATHRPAADDLAGQLLCDADLAILAAAPQRYAAYVAGVRTEYAEVPDPDFRASRRAVLLDLLAKPTLFETAEARERWEATARANLSAEIAALSGPADPPAPAG